jgi:hypothetical protein
MSLDRCCRPALGLALLFALTSGALAEPANKRLFDRFPGIIVACQPAPSVRWTLDACPYLIDEMKRRAALSKLPVSIQGYTSDMARKQFGEMDGFNGDKAIRVGLVFKESSSVKGRVELSIASYWVWEPTAKEIPNVAPGQRLPQIFYVGSIQFEPAATLKTAESYFKVELDTFFNLGEGKL